MRLVFIPAKQLYRKKARRPADAASAIKCGSTGIFALNIAPLLCGDDGGVGEAVEYATADVEAAVRASTEGSAGTNVSGADTSIEDSVADSEI